MAHPFPHYKRRDQEAKKEDCRRCDSPLNTQYMIYMISYYHHRKQPAS